MDAVRFSLLILITCGLATGCGGDDPPDCGAAPTTAPSALIGTGTSSFIELRDGDDLIVDAGPQGGFHFIVHAQAGGIVPGTWQEANNECNPRTGFSAFDQSGERVDAQAPPFTLGYREEELPSGRFLILDDDEVEGLYETDVTLRLRVLDVYGTVAESEVTVTARQAPSTQPVPGAR